MCFVFIWEQTATCATYSINWLVFIIEKKSVYCAIRTGSLNKAVWTHRATRNLHIPNQQHTVHRCFWRWNCRSETCRAVKHIVNKYSTITKVVYFVGLHTQYFSLTKLTFSIRCKYCMFRTNWIIYHPAFHTRRTERKCSDTWTEVHS